MVRIHAVIELAPGVWILLLRVAIAKPFRNAEAEEHQPEGDAHERHDQREPSGIGACAGLGVAPEYKLKQDRGEHSYANHRAAPLQKLARAVMGWAGAFCGGGPRAGWHGEKKSLIHHKGRKRRGWQRRLKFG